jgi:hypothetical protein
MTTTFGEYASATLMKRLKLQNLVQNHTLWAVFPTNYLKAYPKKLFNNIIIENSEKSLMINSSFISRLLLKLYLGSCYFRELVGSHGDVVETLANLRSEVVILQERHTFGILDIWLLKHGDSDIFLLIKFLDLMLKLQDQIGRLILIDLLLVSLLRWHLPV